MKETIFWAVKTLKDAKNPVMKQFNSTSGKTVILPLYSTVELEDRMSHYWRDEFWWNSFIHRQSILLSHPQKFTCTASSKINRNGREKNLNKKGPQSYINYNQSAFIKSFPPTTMSQRQKESQSFRLTNINKTL